MNTVEAAALGVHPGWTAIPNAIYDLPLSQNAIVIYGILLSFKWDNEGCYPSMATLMRRSRLSKNSVHAAIDELSHYKIIKCKHRGEGLSNYYHFLDANTDEMIKRVVKMPARPRKSKQAKAENINRRCQQADETPWDLMEIFQAEVTPSDYISEWRIDETVMEWFGMTIPDMAEPISAQAINEKPSEPQLSLTTTPEIEPSSTEPSAKNAPVEPARDKEKDIQKEKKRFRRTSTQKENSKFTFSVCLAFAHSLRTSGINNPYGYGRTIWQDGSDDKRIAEFVEAQRKNSSSINIEQTAQTLLQRQQLLAQRDAVFNDLDDDAREGLILEKLAEFEASDKHQEYVRMPKAQLIETAIWEIKKELVPGFDQS